MGTLFLPFPPPPSPYTSPPVIVVIPTPSPFSPTKLTTHGPFSLLFFSLFFLFSLLPLSSSDGDLSHLRHWCCRRPKIRISSIFHPTSSSLSLVFHGFFICASPPLLSDFDRHLSSSGSSTIRVSPRPPSPSFAPPPWPDPQPTTASLSFLLFLFPPLLPSISLVFLHRRCRLPVSLPSLFSPPAPPTPCLFFLLPVLVANAVADAVADPPASSPILTVTPAPHSPPPSPSSSVSVPITSLDGTAMAFSALASLRLCCRPPPPPLFSPLPPSWP